jgi:hypothetical protein
MTKLYRRWLVFSCRKHLIEHKYLNGDIWPKIISAPEPSLIMWNNFGKSQLKRNACNNFISFLSFVIMLAGLYGMTIFKVYIEKNFIAECDTDPQEESCEFAQE